MINKKKKKKKKKIAIFDPRLVAAHCSTISIAANLSLEWLAILQNFYSMTEECESRNLLTFMGDLKSSGALFYLQRR
jgi:hypothetical protein